MNTPSLIIAAIIVLNVLAIGFIVGLVVGVRISMSTLKDALGVR